MVHLLLKIVGVLIGGIMVISMFPIMILYSVKKIQEIKFILLFLMIQLGIIKIINMICLE